MTYFAKQLEALSYLSIDSPVIEVLYGAAASTGKSYLGVDWQVMRRLKYPGTRGMFGRASLDSLKKSTLNTFWDYCKAKGLKVGEHYTFNGQSNVIRFHNGSEIYLMDLFYYPSDPNFDSLGSTEFTDAFIEEVAEITEKAVSIVRSRLRYKLNEYGLRPKLLLSCNPSTNWLKSEFYLPYVNGTLPEWRAFVPAKATDNPHTNQFYIESLQKMPEIDRRRLLEGDWDYSDSSDLMFKYSDVERCFNDSVGSGEYCITADIARLGKDRTVIGIWHGLVLIECIEMQQKRTDEVAQIISQKASQYQIGKKKILCDEDGIGGGVVDMLRCEGFHNGGAPQNKERFQNAKNECYFKLAELVEKGLISFRAGPKETILKELEAVRREKPEGDTKLSVISKDKMKTYLSGKSPDYADMIMMRMHFETKIKKGSYGIRTASVNG